MPASQDGAAGMGADVHPPAHVGVHGSHALGRAPAPPIRATLPFRCVRRRTRMMLRTSRRMAALVLVAALATGVAACGSDDNGGAVETNNSSSASTAAPQTLLSSLPASIQQSKEIKVGSD